MRPTRPFTLTSKLLLRIRMILISCSLYRFLKELFSLRRTRLSGSLIREMVIWNGEITLIIVD